MTLEFVIGRDVSKLVSRLPSPFQPGKASKCRHTGDGGENTGDHHFAIWQAGDGINGGKTVRQHDGKGRGKAPV
jgi:hypothetical protein